MFPLCLAGILLLLLLDLIANLNRQSLASALLAVSVNNNLGNLLSELGWLSFESSDVDQVARQVGADCGKTAIGGTGAISP